MILSMINQCPENASPGDYVTGMNVLYQSDWINCVFLKDLT
jgi:hypothetical protein